MRYKTQIVHSSYFATFLLAYSPWLATGAVSAAGAFLRDSEPFGRTPRVHNTGNSLNLVLLKLYDSPEMQVLL